MPNTRKMSFEKISSLTSLIMTVRHLEKDTRIIKLCNMLLNDLTNYADMLLLNCANKVSIGIGRPIEERENEMHTTFFEHLSELKEYFNNESPFITLLRAITNNNFHTVYVDLIKSNQQQI